MTPIGSWNLPTLRDPSGQPITPEKMWEFVSQDSGPLDINKLPKRILANIVWDATNAGRSRLDFFETGLPGLAFNVTIWAKVGGQTYELSFRCDLPGGVMEAVAPPTHPCIDPTPFPNMSGSSVSFSFPRPDSGFDAPLGDLEPGDEFGNTYKDFPPEFLAQPGVNPKKAALNLIRCDAYAFKMRQPALAFDPNCTQAWLESIGANTNENGTVLYQPMIVMYSDAAQDGILKDYRRNHTHGLIGEYSQGMAAVRKTSAKMHANGLWVQYHDLIAERFEDLASDKSMDIAIVGLEADLKLGNQNGELDALLRRVCAACVPKGIPVWVHLSSTGGPNHKQNWACPVPGVDYTDWWEMLHLMGVTGLKGETWMWARRGINPGEDLFSAKGDAWDGDSAGKMGAMFGYSRRGLQAASARHPERPPLLFCASEVWSEPRFYGWTDKVYPLRRTREILACPEPGCPGIAGSDSGTQDWNADLQPW